MKQELQQAILATRDGETMEAQRLLTEVLTDDPDQVQAWFLLSHLVDSEQKQIAYLKKVVALDPDHEKARGRLARLTAVSSTPPQAAELEVPAEATPAEPEVIPEPEPARPISAKPQGFDEQAEGDTLPEWLVEEESAPPASVEAEAETAVSDLDVDPEELPGWLEGTLDEDWSGAEGNEEAEAPVAVAPEPAPDTARQSTPAIAKTATPPSSMPTAAPVKTAVSDQEVMLTRILYGLIATAALVLIALAYVLIVG